MGVSGALRTGLLVLLLVSAPAPALGETATPGIDWPMWRQVGWVSGGIGVAAVVYSQSLYRSRQYNLTPAEQRQFRVANQAAWVLTGAAAVLVITAYVMYDGPHGQVAAGVGPTSVSLTGRF